jgi:alkylation response protein AidB-like acyl-CoA dehydrogenase
VYEESFKYAHKRKTFGKFLIENQTIRSKLANMIKSIESTYSWLEFLTYQLSKMSDMEANIKLGGTFALLKVHTTQLFEFCIKGIL